MTETTRKKHLNTLKKLRKELDSRLTTEQKEAIDYAIAAIQVRLLAIGVTNLIAFLIKMYLGS